MSPETISIAPAYRRDCPEPNWAYNAWVRESGIRIMEPSEKYKAARASLSPDLREQFDMLVEDYKGVAQIHTKMPFVNYKILAALIDAGWCRKPLSKQGG